MSSAETPLGCLSGSTTWFHMGFRKGNITHFSKNASRTQSQHGINGSWALLLQFLRFVVDDNTLHKLVVDALSQYSFGVSSIAAQRQAQEEPYWKSMCGHTTVNSTQIAGRNKGKLGSLAGNQSTVPTVLPTFFRFHKTQPVPLQTGPSSHFGAGSFHTARLPLFMSQPAHRFGAIHTDSSLAGFGATSPRFGDLCRASAPSEWGGLIGFPRNQFFPNS